uniref:Uncharacterized protein n=1 Tax=Ditylenchus dipsaci TaxID=166011 RepID=A0A915CN63_9BILA
MHDSSVLQLGTAYTSIAFYSFVQKLPPVAPHPSVVPLDREKIMKLDGLVKQCCTILSTRDLSNIAEAKLAHLSYVGEPFQEMLDRFEENASVERSEPVRLTDDENQLVERFLAEDRSAVKEFGMQGTNHLFNCSILFCYVLLGINYEFSLFSS